MVSQAGRTVAATPGMVVPAGATLSTGAGSRAIVVRGRDFVTLAPGSRLALPSHQDKRGFLQLVQEWGNAIFQVEKQAKPHFGVRTPYLAAVVKGTTFSITVGAEGASLQVVEGLVETSTIDGGARDLIRPGAVAIVRSEDPYRLSVQGAEAQAIDSPRRRDPRAAVPAAGAAPSSPSVATIVAQSVLTEPPGSAAESQAGDSAANAAGGQVIAATVVAQPVDLARATAGLISNGSELIAINAAVVANRQAANDVNASRPSGAEPAPDADNGSAPDLPAMAAAASESGPGEAPLAGGSSETQLAGNTAAGENQPVPGSSGGIPALAAANPSENAISALPPQALASGDNLPSGPDSNATGSTAAAAGVLASLDVGSSGSGNGGDSSAAAGALAAVEVGTGSAGSANDAGALAAAEVGAALGSNPGSNAGAAGSPAAIEVGAALGTGNGNPAADNALVSVDVGVSLGSGTTSPTPVDVGVGLGVGGSAALELSAGLSTGSTSGSSGGGNGNGGNSGSNTGTGNSVVGTVLGAVGGLVGSTAPGPAGSGLLSGLGRGGNR
nr:FecR domain-containing protein [Novosphingobium piscinae]